MNLPGTMREALTPSRQESKKCRRDFAAPWQGVNMLGTCSEKPMRLAVPHDGVGHVWIYFGVSCWGHRAEVMCWTLAINHATVTTPILYLVAVFRLFHSIQHRRRRLDCSFRQMELSINHLLFSKVCFLGFRQKYRRSWQRNVAQRKRFEVTKGPEVDDVKTKLLRTNLEKAKGLVYMTKDS